MAHGGQRAHLVTEIGSTGTAPSNKWDPFFGTPEGYHEEVRADDQLSHETYNLPKAYEGRNKRLEDILDFMIRQEDEFYTRDLLPWEYTDDIHIVWDVWKFNRTLADVVPEQGISRLVTQENERHTDNLVRRGLAFQLEHGFMTTDKGRRNYALNLQQISDAVHTTCYFGVMHALFAGQNYYKEYRRKFARYVKGPRTLFRHERQMWACLQKDIKGVYIMDAEIKHHMKINGITPDVLVLPPKAGIYVSMVPPSETTYSDRGPGAHEALTDNRTDIQTFRGSKVFEAQSFDVDFQHEFIDLTARPRMCGEYFVIPSTTAPHDLSSTIGRILDDMVGKKYSRGPLPKLGGRQNSDFNKLHDENSPLGKIALAQKEDPFIHIYSAERDDYVKILYSEANAAALNLTNEKATITAILRACKDELDVIHDIYEKKAKDAVAAATTPKAKKDTAAKYSATLKDLYDNNIGIGDRGAIRLALNGLDGNYDRESLERLRKSLPHDRDDLYDEAGLLQVRVRELNEKSRGEIGSILSALPKLVTITKNVESDEARELGHLIKLLELEIHNAYLRYHASQDHHNYDILLLRPFATYTMHSAIMAKGGSDLGSTYHGHHDFQLSDNVATKTHFGNYTFYSKPVVKRPRNYTIIPDCFAQGYISGEGHSFFMPPSRDDPHEMGDLGRAISEGSLGSADCHHSLIAWRIPAGEGEKLADAIDITGRFAGVHRDFEKNDRPHFSGADALSVLESIEELDQNRTDEAYLHQVQHVNTVCFRGAQYTNGKFTHHGKGHWGTPYAGVLPVRDGALMYMDPSKEPQKGDQIV
jgi:hypothetical protein